MEGIDAIGVRLRASMCCESCVLIQTTQRPFAFESKQKMRKNKHLIEKGRERRPMDSVTDEGIKERWAGRRAGPRLEIG